MKYKKKLSAAILSLLIFIISNSYAQSSAVPSPNIISPSPTSSSLGKFGEIPVSLYTGTTNISIPIHTISNGSLKMPVNINYHTSGIKVGEEASWVGLGWSLNAGGVINRSIRGLSDLNENQEYYNLHTGFPDVKMIENTDPITGDYNQPEDNNAHLYTSLFRDIYHGKVDTEPDVFYFNFLGYSGKFYIKKRETVNDEYEFLIESKEKMKIRIFDQGNFSYRWEITVADGTVFTFSTAEKAKISNWKTVSSVDSFFTKTPKPGFDPIHTLTWYLDGIQTASGDNVSFEYTTPLIHGTRKVTSFTQTVSQKIYQIGSNVHCPSPEFEYDYLYASSSLNYDVYLKKIYSANETIEFIHSDRIDYPSDFSAINGFIPELLDAHIHNIPIETTFSKEENGIKKYVGSVFNEYAKNNKGILPIRTYILELDKPISNFISSASTINGLPIDANYKISNQYYYNPNSNQPYMVEDRLTKSIYLWGYNNQYLVAKVIGSDYNTVITRISQLNIDNATALNNNDVAVRALLNGLRTSFASDPLVQVTTYTYSPLIGMTSETSPDGRTIYYEYDGFNRLHLIKDDQGKVLKKICYNYLGQQVNCN